MDIRQKNCAMNIIETRHMRENQKTQQKHILCKGVTVQYIHEKVKNQTEEENRTEMIDYTLHLTPPPPIFNLTICQVTLPPTPFPAIMGRDNYLYLITQ